MTTKKDDKSKADEPIKVQIVAEAEEEVAVPPPAFPPEEQVPPVKDPLTNTVVHVTDRLKVRELESGDESFMHPVDAKEAVATGRYEIVAEGMAKQVPNDEAPTVITGSTNAVLEPIGTAEDDKLKSSKKK
jgi:hypothetical protein